MPAGAIGVDRILPLGFMAVLAGRCLRTALGLGGLRREQGNGADRHNAAPKKMIALTNLLDGMHSS